MGEGPIRGINTNTQIRGRFATGLSELHPQRQGSTLHPGRIQSVNWIFASLSPSWLGGPCCQSQVAPPLPPPGSPRDCTRGVDCRVRRRSFCVCVLRGCGALRDHGHGHGVVVVTVTRCWLMAAVAVAGATRASGGPVCAWHRQLRGAG